MRAAAGAAFVLAAATAGFACRSGTGPDAPPRANGCIDCQIDAAIYGIPDGSPSGSNGSDPLEGTSKEAAIVKGGFRLVAGPVWIAPKLLFTDVTGNAIKTLTLDGVVADLRGGGGTTGLAVDPNGRLVACESGNHQLVRSDAMQGAAKTVIASQFGGKKFNSAFDVIVKNDGNIYFTDPDLGGADMASNQLPVQAAYRIDTSQNVTRLGGTFTKPGGIALSPNQQTIYVVDTGAGAVYSAPVAGDGSVGTFGRIADTPNGRGIAVDDNGNIYVADDNGIDVFDASGKTVIGTISVPGKASNCSFGGNDRKSLFITANVIDADGGGGLPENGVYVINLNIPGLP